MQYRERLCVEATHIAFDIEEIIDNFDRKLFSKVTHSGYCLHYLIPPKTSAHCTVKSECFGSTFWVGTQLPPGLVFRSQRCPPNECNGTPQRVFRRTRASLVRIGLPGACCWRI